MKTANKDLNYKLGLLKLAMELDNVSLALHKHFLIFTKSLQPFYITITYKYLIFFWFWLILALHLFLLPMVFFTAVASANYLLNRLCFFEGDVNIVFFVVD